MNWTEVFILEVRLRRPGEDKKVRDALPEDHPINHSIFTLSNPQTSNLNLFTKLLRFTTL
jgi:hypothetical protein